MSDNPWAAQPPADWVSQPVTEELGHMIEHIQAALIDLARDEMATRNERGDTETEPRHITVATVGENGLMIEAVLTPTQPGPWDPDHVKVERVQLTGMGDRWK